MIPSDKVEEMIKEMHKTHCGFGKTYTLAKQLYFWPIMRTDIKQFCDKCTMCAELRPNQPSTPMTSCRPSNAAGAPMRYVTTDLFNVDG